MVVGAFGEEKKLKRDDVDVLTGLVQGILDGSSISPLGIVTPTPTLTVAELPLNHDTSPPLFLSATFVSSLSPVRAIGSSFISVLCLTNFLGLVSLDRDLENGKSSVSDL